jgi:hypothetical protein
MRLKTHLTRVISMGCASHLCDEGMTPTNIKKIQSSHKNKFGEKSKTKESE